MKSKSFEIDMCSGPIMPKLISFSLPLMLSGVLQLLFNAVDIIVVGRFSGKEALAAVGSTSALINTFTNLFIGLSLGSNVLSARYYASGKKKEMEQTVHTSIATALLTGIFMIFVGFFFARAALGLMGTPEDVIDLSVLYMHIYFCGMPFFMVYNYGAAILRAVGDTKRPLLYLIIAGCVNAIVNVFLVTVFHMGVAGVAIATVFSQAISCFLVCKCLIKTDGPYRLILRKLKIHPGYLYRICQIGIPAGIQSTVINFSNVLLQSSVNSFGSISMAGYTAASNVQGFLYMALNSISQGCMSFTSQNYGARKFKRIDTVVLDCMILDTIVGLILGTLAYLLGPQILRIYTSDPAIISSGMEILAVTAVLYFTCGYMDALPGAMRGLGYSSVPMFLSIIGTVGFRLIWIFLIFPHHRTLGFLFVSYPGSWFITVILQAFYFFKIRKKIQRDLA